MPLNRAIIEVNPSIKEERNMPYVTRPPDPESFVAESKAPAARLYAELADVPLYANMRVHAPGIVGRREWFRLGWVIGGQRLANGRDAFTLPKPILEWCAAQMKIAYPDHETASGLTADEVAELEREQAEKRAKHMRG
jgi:hypothetical protein